MSTFDLFSSYNEENQDEIPVRRDSARKSGRMAEKKRKRGRVTSSKVENESDEDEVDVDVVGEQSSTVAIQEEIKSDKPKQATVPKTKDIFQLFDEPVFETKEEVTETSKIESAVVNEQPEINQENEIETKTVVQEIVVDSEVELDKSEITNELVEEKLGEQIESSVSDSNENSTIESAEIIEETQVETKEEDLKQEEVLDANSDELANTVNQLINLVHFEDKKDEANEVAEAPTSNEFSLTSNTEKRIPSEPEISTEPPKISSAKPFISLRRTPPKSVDKGIVQEDEEEKKPESVNPFMFVKRQAAHVEEIKETPVSKTIEQPEIEEPILQEFSKEESIEES
jgi:hypothetical protein